ncbi:MAG: FtsH protease activity modulator HflK [Isosphaeraceae bacterium]
MKSGYWRYACGALLASGYLSSGLTVLQPDEVGVVRRLGAVLAEPWEPGLHWGLPWGFDRIDRLKVNQTRTFAVGASGSSEAPVSRAPDPASDDFLTGDLNLVTAEALVQYRVRDPVAYLFHARDVESMLRASSEWALTRALARRGIDELLTTGRGEVADWLSHLIQSLCDERGLGISVVAVRLGRVTPPAAVAPAFADAARARSDRRQAITRAEEYRDRSQSESRGLAREIADSAAGQFDRIVQPARGEAERFSRVLAEAHKAPDAFRRRMLLETLAELLPRFRRTVVVTPGQDLDISLFEDRPGSPGFNETSAEGPGGRE